jgi:hypothetical protein
MHTLVRRGRPAIDRTEPRIRGDGRAVSHIHRWASDRALCYAIEGHLETARFRLDEALASCDRRVSLAGRAEDDDRGQAPTHHRTDLDSLKRVRDRLDRIAARFQEAMSCTELRYLPGPLDIARDDTLHGCDLALADVARALVRRFDEPGAPHDFRADLEWVLSDFERILDERARLHPRNERRQVPERPDRTGALHPAKGFGMAEGVRTRADRDEALSCAFEEDLDALRQVDRALEQVDRCMSEARADRPLQEFWRGVQRDYEEEAHRLAQRIGREAIRLTRVRQ